MKPIGYFLLPALLIVGWTSSANAQPFSFTGPRYDTMYTVMYSSAHLGYDLNFSGNELSVWMQFDASANFTLYNAGVGFIPHDQPFQCTVKKNLRYLSIFWNSKAVPEDARLRIWTETSDTTTVDITGILSTPTELIWNPVYHTDSTLQGKTLCLDRTIFNFTGAPITITELFFTGNYRANNDWHVGVNYTIQNMPALPLTIPDKDSIVLTICYTPLFADEFDNDTLLANVTRGDSTWLNRFYLFGLSLGSGSVGITPAEPVAAYPNPVRSQLTVSGLSAGIHRVRVLDALGRKIMEEERDGESLTLNVDALAAGHYILQVGDRLPYHFIKIVE